VRYTFFVLLLALLVTAGVHAAELDTGYLFSVSGSRDFAQSANRVEVNWIPELKLDVPVSDKLSLQGEYSFMGRVYGYWNEEQESDISMDSYRYWVRIGLPQTDLRMGLQKINFGSAKLLRPLQWFDRIDPLDKSEYTTGVKAGVFKHNWLNNANIWVWGVLGEDSIKGNEFIAGKDKRIEPGARLQVPNPLGESAISYHQRQTQQGDEYRLGFDHRYDGAIGAWMEANAAKFEWNNASAMPRYMLASTVGMDWTAAIGNGIAITLEHMQTHEHNNNIDKLHTIAAHTALMLNYPLGLLDSITVLGVHAHTADTDNVAIVWRRAYDYLSWDLSLSLDRGYTSMQSHSPGLNLKISYDL
jgi:hypothetical protein